jgi:glucose/arabinose dehydrogenase
VARRLSEEAGRTLVVVIGVVVAAILLAGGGAAIACKKTSLNCHLGGGASLERTSGEVTLPDGFSAEVVAGDLDVATDFSFLPDGRVLVAERSGLVRIYDEGTPAATPLLDLTAKVNDSLWRGLMTVAVDPDFEENGYVYVVYTGLPRDKSGDSTEPTHVVVARYTVRDDNAVDERILLGADGEQPGSCSALPASADCIPAEHDHVGADIAFADDGTMFVSTGDGGGKEQVEETAFTAQDVDALSGKILRIDREGRGLASNPFSEGDTAANRSKVWALGVRNPFRMTLTTSGTPVVGDVGWLDADEIDVATAGVNLGWPCYEGLEQTHEYKSTERCRTLYASGKTFTKPVLDLEHSGGNSVTGGAFVEGEDYPAEYRGYLYGDWVQGWLRVAPIDAASGELTGDERDFATEAGGPVAFRIGPDGRLYYLALNHGALYRIEYSA